MSSTSFFPSKPLGGYGDGGCLFTNDDNLAEITRSLRVHGAGKDRYDHIRVGINSRLDTFQAAILLEKLAIFDEELERRQQIANHYAQALKAKFQVPELSSDVKHAYGLYTIRTQDEAQRNHLSEHLRKHEVPCTIYYHKPLHQQTAYEKFPCVNQTLSVTDQLAKEVLSIPMHPYLTDQQLEHITQTINQA